MRELCLLCLLLSAAATFGQEWREIKPPPTRWEISTRYQLVTPLDPLDQPEQWKPATYDLTARGRVAAAEGREPGQKAIRVEYEFAGRDGLEYLELERSLPLGPEVKVLGLWMRGGRHTLPARLRLLDASGECFQYNLGPLVPDEWTLGVASLDQPNDHWGGDKNGKPDPPLRLASLLFDKLGSHYKATGALTFAELGVYEMRPERARPHGVKVFIPPAQTLLVYEPQTPVRLAVGVDPKDPTVGSLPVRLAAQLVDPFGNILQTTTVVVAGEQPVPLQVTPPAPGAYDLRLRPLGKENDLDAPWADLRFALLPTPPAQDDARPFGVATHFGQSWPTSPAMPLMARAGIKFYRDEMYWDWGGIEAQKGVLTVPDKYRAYLAEGTRQGLEPLIIVDYGNRLYDGGGFPVSTEARAGFARYAATLARELPAIRYFEIWNEWCGGCGMNGKQGVAAEYAPLFLEASKAIRAASPKAMVVGIGGEWDRRNLQGMMSGGAGAAMDAFSMHPYMYPSLPGQGFREHLLKDTEAAKEAAGKPLPLWITEIGWPTNSGGNGSGWLHQARCLVRMMVIALGSGVEKIVWYDFKDDGLKPEYNEHNFGLVHHDDYAFAPKPAYVAYANLIRLLHGRKVIEQKVTPEGLWRTVLDDGKSLVTVLWAAEPGQKLNVPVPAGGRVETMFGAPLQAAGTVTVTVDPVFVISPR
ncbi:MAG: cellulase family glycosylhydrolase [Armatimonadia bacterium]